MKSDDDAHAVRLAYVTAVQEAGYEEDGNTRRYPPYPAPDAIAAAAVAVAEHFGWWCDPVLDAETALEYAEVVVAALLNPVMSPHLSRED